MTTINIILYIVAKIIKTMVIIQLVKSLYDYFFKEDKKHEDHNF